MGRRGSSSWSGGQNTAGNGGKIDHRTILVVVGSWCHWSSCGLQIKSWLSEIAKPYLDKAKAEDADPEFHFFTASML